MSDSTTTPHTETHDGDHGWIHIVPARVLLAVFAALILLTLVTVAVTWVDLGGLNLWIAMFIATVKASLVALYFMHLRYDKSFCTIVFLASLVFVFLFIGVVLLDTLQYQPDVEQWQRDQLP
jgi:cytochrome c oxidase subunit 4